MTVNVHHVIPPTDLYLFIAIFIIEVACLIIIIAMRHRRKHPKYIEDPPWPASPITTKMRNYLDEFEKESK